MRTFLCVLKWIPYKAYMSTLNIKCLDLSSLKKPFTINYNEKNDIRPFEDVTKMEFYCKKNDSSLFMLGKLNVSRSNHRRHSFSLTCLGNHNKKRPHNLILGRMFDYQLLDMVELGLENFKSLQVDIWTMKIINFTPTCGYV